MRSSRSCDAAAGFVLVEAIAVLALSGLVLMTLLIASGLIARNSGLVAARANEMEGMNTGFSALQRDISAAQPRLAAGSDSPLLFQGSPTSVGFVAAADTGGGQALISIDARTADGQGVLLRSSAPLLPQTTGFADAAFAHPVILFAGPWTYHFSFGKAGDGPVEWSDSWSDPKQLPDLVQLQILDAAGDHKVPPLFVSLRVQSQGRCDPSSDPKCQNQPAQPPAKPEGTGRDTNSG